MVLVFGVWPALAWWNRSYTDLRAAGHPHWHPAPLGRDIPLNRINDVAFDQGVLRPHGRLRHAAGLGRQRGGHGRAQRLPDVHQVSLRMNELVRQIGDR